MALARLSRGVSELDSPPFPCWERPVLPIKYSRSTACYVDCRGCPESDPDPSPDSVPLAGWSLAGTAVLTFLVPLVFALTGAVILQTSPAGQLLGCVAGLVLGILVVRSLVLALTGREGRPE